MNRQENPITPDERESLDELVKHSSPPSYLFTKIVEIMKSEDHIRTPKPLLNLTPGGILTAFALAAGLVCLGFFVGKGDAPATSSAYSDQAKFILLVHNDDQPPADPMQQVKEYGEWLGKISADRIAGGEHLHGNGWVLSPKGTEAIAEFPGRNEVGGYFTFEAANAEEALKIAKTCPHLRYQGTLELRQIHQ